MKSFDPRAPENQVPENVSRQCGYCDYRAKEMTPIREHLADVHAGQMVYYRFAVDEVPA